MYLLAAVMFFLLSPGVVLTLPPGSKGVWMSGQTSLLAALVHSIVFVVVSHYVWQWVKKTYHVPMNMPRVRAV